jgi:hypothetical protein
MAVAVPIRLVPWLATLDGGEHDVTLKTAATIQSLIKAPT